MFSMGGERTRLQLRGPEDTVYGNSSVTPPTGMVNEQQHFSNGTWCGWRIPESGKPGQTILIDGQEHSIRGAETEGDRLQNMIPGASRILRYRIQREGSPDAQMLAINIPAWHPRAITNDEVTPVAILRLPRSAERVARRTYVQFAEDKLVNTQLEVTVEDMGAKVHGVEQAERVQTGSKAHRPESRLDGAPTSFPQFKPVDENWGSVSWKGEIISLRKREKAKEFLRMLWDKPAKRRSKAIPTVARFKKPSSLFSAGEKFVSHGIGPTRSDLPVESELGARIHRVYAEAVGKVPPAKKGKGRIKYYLRVFTDSDST